MLGRLLDDPKPVDVMLQLTDEQANCLLLVRSFDAGKPHNKLDITSIGKYLECNVFRAN